MDAWYAIQDRTTNFFHRPAAKQPRATIPPALYPPRPHTSPETRNCLVLPSAAL